MNQNISVPKGFRPEPFSYHEELEVVIDSLSNLGIGVGRWSGVRGEESIEDWVVFVPGALPGEKIKVKIWKNEKNCSQADLVEVLEASEKRVEPKCPLFGQCGGCQYQHLGYDEQLLWKQRQVGELLVHMADIHEAEINPTIGSPKQWNYRSKITPHFHKPKKGTQEIGSIGFLATGTRSRLVDVPQCPIAMESLNEALVHLRKQVVQNAATYKKGATLLLRASADGKVEIEHGAVVEERVGDLTFHFLAGDFFQNNPSILPDFTGYVGEKAAGEGIDFLVDAYCGSGLFGLTLAKHFKQVKGVEVSATSADWARHNARMNDIGNAEFINASAEAIFEEIDFESSRTTVLIDPPRKGCGGDFLEQLFRFEPKRVVYVSCNPSTQVRDLQEFVSAGYKLIEVQPFDLFPQTRHLECVMVLEKV